jgi:hypothetical protein
MCHQQHSGFFQRLERPLTRNRRKTAKKLFQRVTAFKVVEKGLDWNARASEHGNSVHRFRISGNRLRHLFIVSQARWSESGRFFRSSGRHPAAKRSAAAATAPALIVVGSMMMTTTAESEWADPGVAIPRLLTMIAIPLTFSIANGLACGFIAYTFLQVLRGRFRKVNWTVYVLTGLFMVRFWYLGK